MHHKIKDYLNVFIALSIGLAISIAGSDNGLYFKGYPILIICMLVSFFVHWILFIPAFIYRTEKFYDISGTLAYVFVIFTVSLLTWFSSGGVINPRSWLVIVLVIVWALRLGIFLFIRVLKAGEDRRFREVKQKFSAFLVWWTISALWVFLTTVNALVMIINNVEYHNDYFLYIGLLLWITGFLFEVIADEQKRRFRLNVLNQDQFISIGLWSISRHPNYFGEILIWVGMSIIAYPTLDGWQYLSLISPVFIYLLITKMSGVNLLEDYADKKWGGNEDYENYKRNTPVLFPFFK